MNRLSPRFTARFADARGPLVKVEILREGEVVHTTRGLTYLKAYSRAVRWMAKNGDPR